MSMQGLSVCTCALLTQAVTPCINPLWNTEPSRQQWGNLRWNPDHSDRIWLATELYGNGALETNWLYILPWLPSKNTPGCISIYECVCRMWYWLYEGTYTIAYKPKNVFFSSEKEQQKGLLANVHATSRCKSAECNVPLHIPNTVELIPCQEALRHKITSKNGFFPETILSVTSKLVKIFHLVTSRLSYQ